MSKKKFINSMVLGVTALSLTMSPASAFFGNKGSKDKRKKVEREKCYGVAKAGQNDCGNLAKTHSCAGHAVRDNDPGEWILLEKGLCNRLGNGKLLGQIKNKTRG